MRQEPRGQGHRQRVGSPLSQTRAERKEIFSVHLKKRKRDPSSLDMDELAAVPAYAR